MTLSSCEVEHMVALLVTWIEMLLEELKIMESKKMKLFTDNKSTIDLINHSVCHSRNKHT